MSSSLAIVERKPPLNGGGCAGGVLFHLLDWHRRLARKRRIFSPRRLLPSSLRSAPRRLPAPPPTPPPLPAQNSTATADGAAPGVVARLMGLESWPGSGAAGAPRPQKQRKVEASPPDVGDSAVVLVLPTTRRPPAPALAPSPAAAPRSHHGSDLPARSPRRTRLVHAAAAKLLEPGARASSRASARLAFAYACSSPQHRKDGHSGALLQGSGMADDFLSRSESLSTLERSTRSQPPVPPAEETECDRAAVSRRHGDHSFNSGDAVIGASSTVVLPRMDFGAANMSKSSSDVDAARKERRIRNEGISTCAKVRSSISTVRAGDERLRKRATPTRPEVSESADPVGLASSTRQFGRAHEPKTSAGRRVAHSSPGPRREITGSVTRNTQCRDVIHRSGLASTTSRISSNGSGPKRVSRKNVGCAAASSNTDDRNAVVFASRSSPKPVARASSHNNVSKSGRPSRRAPNTTSARMPAADQKSVEASASVMATSEKDEFSRLLKAKINELGMSDRIEFTSSDTLSGKLTAPVLQELISALNNDMHVSASQSSNCFEASATLYSSGNGGCIDQSGYAFSGDRSPDFQKCYQGEQDVDSSAASMNNEPNQPSPMSVLEACFSNDTSSLGSPVEKNEGKDLFVPIEKKMEDVFNLESDIVELEKSIDTRKAGAEEMFHGDGMLSCLENSIAHDFKFLESRLHSIAEAISNAELLLGSGLTHGTTSSLALHPFIMDMLETSAGVFGGELSLDLAEEKKYQHTNFLFDCIIESLDSKFGYFGKCGYKAWLKLPLSLSKDQLKQELVEVIGNWKESGAALSRVADKELDQVTTRWDACQNEVFDISVSIEDDILEALAVELALDLW
ncbi:hypothetical protein EJB05_31747 [Eragrostis curvula]|uniref:DUF4378 domain-containing protein n=1 Tax=Eragrostis curvula TaxID=38414 RepID=A0A5J9UFT4_9POAL|nr:hypothetical protein EJB05_31747 [Eragrostis curvula]